MKLETFFDKFELFADAPDAVGKMRELVLDLAVTGRLVAHREKWQTRSLKSLASKIGSGATPSGGREFYVNSGTPLVRSMNVHFRGFDRTGLVFLTDEQAEGLSNVIIQPNDVLLNITGASIGRVTTAPAEMAGARVNQHVTIIRPSSELLSKFLAMFLASPTVQRMIDEIQVGATRQALTKGMIEEFEISLPPLAEQERIVAKVDELMVLCDQLEAQQQERQTRHTLLARASLARFADAPTPANLDFLFHKSYDISLADLRQAILTLAVQCRLVPTVESRRVVLADVIELISGQHLLAHEQNELGKGIPYLTGPSDFGAQHPSPSRWTETPKVVAEPGDILITVKGSGVGKTNKLVAEQTAISRQLMAVRVTGADPDFIHLVLMNAAEYFQASMTGIAIPGIGRKDVLDLVAELPSLAEQRRIVAKVDQLMASIGQLETQLTASRSTAEKLTSAIIADLTSQD